MKNYNEKRKKKSVKIRILTYLTLLAERKDNKK